MDDQMSTLATSDKEPNLWIRSVDVSLKWSRIEIDPGQPGKGAEEYKINKLA